MSMAYCSSLGHVTCKPFLQHLAKTFCTCAVVAVFATFPQCVLLSSVDAYADDEIKFTTPDSVVKEIAECLHRRGEFIVDPQDSPDQCVAPQWHAKTRTELPFNVSRDEIDKICRDGDRRALSGDTIKRIVAQANGSIGPMGIRLIGGVYCDQVDLAGLDLKYSLILDKAVFRGGIAARNLRVKGDFSIDGSLVFNSLTLNRARVDGSFYHEDGFIQREIVTDTKIEGTWHQSGTVIFSTARFQHLTASGDLDVSESALNRFLIEGSQIGGGLILNDSEARCSYDIRSSDIGLVLAERAGLGTGTKKSSATIQAKMAQPHPLFIPGG